ncbi:MAG: hypothetical protein J2P48_06645 [Alphaproteobacteria bacterium]|nr:hypothetical protein [Alphaproteobacteria bacterium]
MRRRFAHPIPLKNGVGGDIQPARLKIDPGADVTGVAIVRDTDAGRAVLHLCVIAHNPQTSGAQYQQSELCGYKTREYLLEEWECSGAWRWAAGVPLRVDPVRPSSEVARLTLPGEACSLKKDPQPVDVCLKRKADLLRRIPAHGALGAAAAVNTGQSRRANRLAQMGLPIELSRGGRTRWNRTRLRLPKTHSPDTVCVGSLEALAGRDLSAQQIGRIDRGACRRTRLPAHGFPRSNLMPAGRVRGFQTGEIVRAIVPDGNKAGVIIGRAAIRTTASASRRPGALSRKQVGGTAS